MTIKTKFLLYAKYAMHLLSSIYGYESNWCCIYMSMCIVRR